MLFHNIILLFDELDSVSLFIKNVFHKKVNIIMITVINIIEFGTLGSIV